MFQNHLARVKSWLCIELFKFGVLLLKVSLSYMYSNKVSPMYLWFVSLFLSLLDSLCSNSYATSHPLFCFSNLSLYFTLHPWCSQSKRGKLQEAHVNKPSFVKFSFSRVDLMTPPQNICLYYGNIWIAGEPMISLSDVLPTVLTHQEPKMTERKAKHTALKADAVYHEQGTEAFFLKKFIRGFYSLKMLQWTQSLHGKQPEGISLVTTGFSLFFKMYLNSFHTISVWIFRVWAAGKWTSGLQLHPLLLPLSK